MKATSKSEMRIPPQRRNRGITIKTAPNASATPTAIENGKAKSAGTRNCSIACDHWNGSESFQQPETKNRIASRTANTLLAMDFHCGRSTTAVPRYSAGSAVLCDIYHSIVKQGETRANSGILPRVGLV